MSDRSSLIGMRMRNSYTDVIRACVREMKAGTEFLSVDCTVSGVDVGVLHLDSYHGQVRGALSV